MSGFWDRWAGLYDLVEWSNRRVNAAAAERVGALIPAGASVLDCAAGTGLFSLAAAERAGRVLCSDLSEAMLDRAFTKAKHRGLTNLDFQIRDLLCLPDRDGAFDVTIAANVLHLLDAPEQAVAQLWRVTVPGGLVILPTYLQGETVPFFQLLIHLYQKAGFHYQTAFTLDSYRAFLEGLGYGAVQAERIEGRIPEGLAVLRKPL